MIDFGLCQQCDSCGEWEPGEQADDVGDGVRPSVKCDLTGDVLLMNSEPPEDCPYSLEHKLVTQDVPASFANYMSGCTRRSSEGEF